MSVKLRPDIQPVEPIAGITLEPKQVIKSADAFTGTFKATVIGLSGVGVYTSDEWISCSLDGGIVTYSVGNNTSDKPRRGSISVYGTDFQGFKISNSFSILQQGYESEEIEITTSFGNTLIITDLPQSGSFTISGAPYFDLTVTTDVDWLDIVKDSQIAGWRWTAKRNSSTTVRLAKIFVVYTNAYGVDTEYVFYCTQLAQIIIPYIKFNGDKERHVGYMEQELVVPFTTANTGQLYVLDNLPSWISVRTTDNLGGNIISPLVLSVEGNYGTAEERTAVVTLTDGSAVAELVVIQAAEGQTDIQSGYALPPTYRIAWDDEYGNIPVVDDNMASWTEITTDSDWIGGGLQEGDDDMLELTLSNTPDGLFIKFAATNNLGGQREAVITIKGTDIYGNVRTSSCTVIQDKYTERHYFPIWKTKIITVTGYQAGTPVDYIITANNHTVCKARGYVTPDGVLPIELNDILRPYCKTVFDPNLSDLAQDTGGLLTGVVAIKSESGEYVTYAEYCTWNDCSYEDMPDRLILSEPVRNEYDPRQLIPVSVINRQGLTEVYSNRRIGFTNRRKTDHFDVETQILTLFLEAEGYSNVRVGASRADDTEEIFLEEGCYTPKTTPKYCLYYLNAYGGIDSLCVRGKVVESDNVTTEAYNRSADNTYPMHAKKILSKRIQKAYTLYTGYLNDTQSRRMRHLLTTTLCWIHDLSTGRITPVNITTSSVVYKTLANDRKVYYTINAEEAFERVRI